MNKFSIFFKKTIMLVSILIFTGCSKSEQLSSQTESNLADIGCPEEPKLKLDKKNVEEISLTNQIVSKSNQVSSNKAIGYAFQAEAGQKLSYQTDEDICIWVYDPNNQLVNRTKLPERGKYVIQVAAPKGSKTFDLEMSLETLTSNTASTTPIPNINESNDSTAYTTSRQYDLTKEQALEIVEGWYSSKPKIFGYPFDKSLVAQYATGQLYYETLEKDGGGSVGWLQRNDCYYTYNFSSIDNIWLFSTSGTRPLLKIQVSEKLQLNGPSSTGCSNRPKYYQKNVSYWFEKDNGAWKIYFYEVE